MRENAGVNMENVLAPMHDMAPMADMDEACRMLAHALDYVEKGNKMFGVRIYEFLTQRGRNPNTGDSPFPCPACGGPIDPTSRVHREMTDCPG